MCRGKVSELAQLSMRAICPLKTGLFGKPLIIKWNFTLLCKVIL